MNDFRQQHLIILAIALTLMCLFLARNPSLIKLPSIFPPYKIKESPPPAKVVELIGIVKYSGIYYLDKEASLEDLLEKAREVRIKDRLEDFQRKALLKNGAKVEILQSSHADFEARVGEMEPKKAISLRVPLDVNRLEPEALQLIPGIGPKLSQAIFQYRMRHGGFKSPDELRSVPGIGIKKARRISRYLSIN